MALSPASTSGNVIELISMQFTYDDISFPSLEELTDNDCLYLKKVVDDDLTFVRRLSD